VELNPELRHRARTDPYRRTHLFRQDKGGGGTPRVPPREEPRLSARLRGPRSGPFHRRIGKRRGSAIWSGSEGKGYRCGPAFTPP
jgi:hypothetical protein